MQNFRLWLTAVIACRIFSSALSQMENCDICTCEVAKKVLLLNCSGVKTRPGDYFGYIRQPNPDIYDHYTFDTIEANFESNRIKKLTRLSLLGISALSLARNEIATLDSGTFLELKTLKTLSLKNNKLETMNQKSFQGLSDLEVLDLSENMLKKLSPGIFTLLKSLRTLSLSHNMIESLDGKVFAIPTLQTLDISRNSINGIGLDIFENADNLITLNISSNKLSTVDKFIFASLASVETFDLSFNKIATVEPHAFSNMKSLKWLSLSRNNLTEVHRDAEIPADLQVLHLSGNALQELGDNLKNLRLQELHVQRNYLQTLEVNGSRLKVLNVSSNVVTSFPTAGYTALEALDLSYNQLHSVPTGLTGLQMPALRWLNLDNNPITDVRFPTAGKEEQDGEIFVNLTWVSLSHMGDVQELAAGAFSGLASPCGACNSGSEKTGVEFEALAQNCSRKLAIRMSHNPRLSKIDVDAFKDVGICSLDLSYNVLSSLDEKLTHWESLDAADLQGNPWDCTCPLQWVLDRLVPHIYRTRQDLLYELRCDVPIQFRNKRLVHFYKWKKAAFCSQTEQLRAVPESDNVEVTFGLSNAMIYIMAGLTTLVAVLVVAGIVLQRRLDSRRRARNRRM